MRMAITGGPGFFRSFRRTGELTISQFKEAYKEDFIRVGVGKVIKV